MSEPTPSGEVFGVYANFYDALYADKDYEAECDYVVDVLAARGVTAPASLLDLGCGTGGHIIPMAGRGFEVAGVDRSPEMAEQARAKAREAGVPIDVHVGDVRNADLGRTFDAVTSMFAVVSYQLENADVLAMFETARRHLASGGVFVFDGWFGPAVLVDQPEERSKTVPLPDGGTVTRVARPRLDVFRQTVDVVYEVTATHTDGTLEHTVESHPVRFLFAQELALMLEASGFELVAFGPFMEPNQEISIRDWNFSAVAVAR